MLPRDTGLLHGEETAVFADVGYQGAPKRPEATGVPWQVAMRPGKRWALDKNTLGATFWIRLKR